MSKQNSNCLPVKHNNEVAYFIYLEKDFDALSLYLSQDGLCSPERKTCIITDSTVAALYGDQVKTILEPLYKEVSVFVFPSGEQNKTLDTVRTLYEYLIQNHFDRKDLLVALGGGVVGDLTGFTAATYLRGIEFIQVPTTLLAQVDSSIGGKTGVDFDSYKNMVGAFYQPKMVYMNSNTLTTLTEEQFACGMGEVLKHGLIRDEAYYGWTIQQMFEISDRNPDILLQLIRRSCEIKRAVVEKDPTEKGERALLNFGHTIGHAVERTMNFSLLHGQCVALGYIGAAHISWKRGLLSNEEFFEIRDMNVGFDLPIIEASLNEEEILQVSRSDKKMEHGKIKFILLKGIGHAYIDHTVTDDEICAAVRFLKGEVEEND